MNRTFSNILIFVAGAGVGSLVTWKLIKTKYEQLTQEEIDSYREACARKLKAYQDKDEEKKPVVHEERPVILEKPDLKEYAKRIEDAGYAHYQEEGEEAATVEEPEIISPDEFGSINYETVYLSYYADKILADDVDDIVEDIEGTVGRYSLTQFGEYEDECIHVRNHRLRTDYEITIDTRSFYEDIKGVSPADE